MRPEQRWCDRIQCHCKVIYDLAIYNEQNLYNLAHCDGFSGTTPPSRKRQGGVYRVPQALQACILAITQLASTRLPGRTEARPIGALHRHRIFDTMMMFFLTDIFAL